MYRTVCFDLDGTLFDDRQYVRGGLESAAAELESITDRDLLAEFLEAYFEREVTEATFDEVLAEHGLSHSYVPRLVDAFHANEADLIPYPGVDETLRTLSSDYDLALITGGRNGRDKLDRLGLRAHFDAITVTDRGKWTKQDPEPFQATLKELDASADATVFVGDRPEIDFMQPNRLGMYTIRVRTGQYATVECTDETQPDAVVHSISDLPVVLAELD